MAMEREVRGSTNKAASSEEQSSDRRSDRRTGGDIRLAQLGSRIAPGVPTRRVGASLSAYAEAAQAVFTAAGGAYDYKTLLLDVTDNPRLNVSSVVVVAQPGDNPAAGAGFHVMLLEGSIEEIAPIQRSENGENFKIQRVVGDAYNSTLVDIVCDAISTKFGVVPSKIYDGRASVVPAELKADEDSQFSEMVIEAMKASAMAVEVTLPDFQDLNLADLDSKQNITTTVVLSAERPVTIAEGYPLRADFKFNVSSVDRSLAAEDTFAFSPESAIASGTGFVDLVYNPTTEGNKDFLYQPAFIINSLECNRLQSTNTALLTISNVAVAATKDNVWTRQFNPRTQHEHQRALNDIGALGYDITGNKKIDTRFEEFTQKDFNDLLKAVVYPSLVFCLDTPETDSRSFWTAPFGFAAAGDREATQHLLDSANRLTNGNFERFYAEKHGRGLDKGGVVVDIGIRVPQGYYVDSDGVKRDIADYDNLAIMNLFGDKDPSVYQDFSDTFLASNGSQDYRLAKRIKILERVRAFKLTGFATRIMFEPAFLEALTAGCGAAGFEPNFRLPHSDGGMQQRATGDRFAFGRTSGMGFGGGNRASSDSYDNTRSTFSRFLRR